MTVCVAHKSTSASGPLWAMAGLALCCCSCYIGGGLGPTFPQGVPPPSKAGANTTLEIGLTYDYKRLVRVGYFTSLQQLDGAVYTAGGQHLVVPLPVVVGVDVTVWRLNPNRLLRATARGYYGSGVRIGDVGKEIEQPGSWSLGGLFGATFHLASAPDDPEGLGPYGLSLTAGLLVTHVDAAAISSQVFLAPMVMFGEVSPFHIFYCWFIDRTCPDTLRGAPN